LTGGYCLILSLGFTSKRPTKGEYPLGSEIRDNLGSDPVLGRALAYWERKRRARPVPARRDIDATEIAPALLPYLQLTERDPAGGRIRYRLVGTGIVAAYGADLTGKYVDEVYDGERLRRITAVYRTACENRRPVLAVNHYHTSRSATLACHRLVMPLVDDGGTIRHFLTAMRFEHPGEAIEWRGAWLRHIDALDDVGSYASVVDAPQPSRVTGGFD